MSLSHITPFSIERGPIDELTVHGTHWHFFKDATTHSPGRFIDDTQRATGSTILVRPKGGASKVFRVDRCHPYSGDGGGFMVSLVPLVL